MGVAFNPTIVTSGLVLCLDAGSSKSYPGSGNTWTDLIGRGNNGTLVSGVGYDSGNGGSLVFDGSNDYISLSPSTRYTTLTQEVWFNTTTVSASRQYLYTQQTSPPTLSEFTYQQRQGCQLEINRVVFQYMNEVNNTFYVTTPQIQANTWYQFVATLNESSYQLYLNGSPVSMNPNTVNNQYASTNTNPKVFTPNKAYIGLRGDAQGNDRFNGKISIFREYNRALTAQEVQQNYNAIKIRFGLT